MINAFPEPILVAGANMRLRLPAALTYSRLELRRNAVLYGSWPAIFAATAGLSPDDSLAAVLLFWIFIGLPLTAVVFGASAGSGLRGAAEEAEAELPLAPHARTWGALVAATAALGVTAAAVFLAVLTAGAEVHAVMASVTTDWDRSLIDVMLRAGAFASAVGTAYLLLASFALTFATGQAVLGGALAVFLAVLTLTPLACGMALQTLYGAQAPFLAQAAACVGAALAGAAAFLGVEAPRVERRSRRSAAGWAGALAVLLAGAGAGWPALLRTEARLAASGRIVERPMGHDVHSIGPWMGPWPPSRRSYENGLLIAGFDGSLRRVEPSGRRVELLTGSPPSLRSLLFRKPRYGPGHLMGSFFGTETSLYRQLPEPPVTSAFYDREGRLWVRREVSDDKTGPIEVWQGLGDGPLKLHGVLPGGYILAQHEGRAALLRYSSIANPDYERFANLPAGKRPSEEFERSAYALLSAGRPGLVWQDEDFEQPFAEPPRPAEGISETERLRTLVGTIPGGRRRVWRLPWPLSVKEGELERVINILPIGGEPAFLVNVTTSRSEHVLVFCRSDGSVATAWKDGPLSYGWSSSPDGAIYIPWSDKFMAAANASEHHDVLPDELMVVAPDGTILPPVPLAPLLAAWRDWRMQGGVVRVADGSIWVAGPGRLLRLSAADGSVQSQTRLSEEVEVGFGIRDRAPHYAARDGVFFISDGRIFFVAWDGGVRDLGPA